MVQASSAAKKKSDSLKLEKIRIKSDELEKVKRHGPPKYSHQEVEEMITKRQDKGIKSGKMAVNLSYMKVEIKSDIGHLEKILADTKDHKTRVDATQQKERLERKLQVIQK